MSKVLVSEDNLSDIADSIRSKLGVQTTYKPGQMSSAIDSIETGGSLDINGVIQNYQANGTINAGDFVSYINAFEVETDKTLTTATNSGTSMSTVALSENKVFVTYPYGANKYLYGIVCTINETTISCGTPVMLNIYTDYNRG